MKKLNDKHIKPEQEQETKCEKFDNFEEFLEVERSEEIEEKENKEFFKKIKKPRKSKHHIDIGLKSTKAAITIPTKTEPSLTIENDVTGPKMEVSCLNKRDESEEDHFIKKKEVNPAECDCKGINFRSKKTQKFHVQTFHQKLLGCDVCKITFQNKANFQQHVQSHHSRTCECEGIESLDERNTLYHNKTVHIKHFGCIICRRTFKSEQKWQVHMGMHNGFRQFQCDNCGKESLRLGDLKAHKKLCLDQEPTNCDLCQKVFRGEYRMQTHRRRFHVDLHQCPECPTQAKSLSRHIQQWHSDEKRFPCSQCDKGFISSDKLKSHIRSVHNKEKPFECRFGCGLRASETGNLRKHEVNKHGQVWADQGGEMVETLGIS